MIHAGALVYLDDARKALDGSDHFNKPIFERQLWSLCCFVFQFDGHQFVGDEIFAQVYGAWREKNENESEEWTMREQVEIMSGLPYRVRA